MFLSVFFLSWQPAATPAEDASSWPQVLHQLAVAELLRIMSAGQTMVLPEVLLIMVARQVECGATLRGDVVAMPSFTGQELVGPYLGGSEVGQDIDSSRPISLMEVLGKIAMSFLDKQVTQIWRDKRVLLPYQFGFQRHCGVAEAARIVLDVLQFARATGCRRFGRSAGVKWPACWKAARRLYCSRSPGPGGTGHLLQGQGGEVDDG